MPLRLKNRKSVKLSKKYLWSFFIVVLVIDLLLTLALFALYSGIQISKSAEYSMAQLEQVGTSTDILYESLEAVVNQVKTDTDTTTFLLNSETDRLQETRVGIKLRTIRTANPYLRYISLYNDTSKRFVSSAYAGAAEVLEPQEYYDRLGDLPYACYFRPIGQDYNVQASKNATVYTFVFRINLKPNSSTDLVVIDVNDNYFNKALAPIRIFNTEQRIIFQDNQGSVVTEMTALPNDNSFANTGAHSDLPPKAAFSSSQSSGSFSYWDSGTYKFGTYAKAQEAGWTIYNILPYNTVLTGVGSLAALTLTLTLVTLAFGYVLSRRISSSLYAPIKTLYENYVARGSSQEKKGNELELLSEAFSEMYSKADQLEQGLISSFHESKNMYLRYLLFGEKKKVQSALLTYDRLQIDLASPYYGVILMECVPQSAEAADDQKQRDANLFICFYALENITRELLSSARGVEFLRTEENQFTILLYLEEEALSDTIRQGLDTVAETMHKEFRIDTTICVGSTVDSWTNINLAYEQARIALNSRSPSHYGRVFSARDASHSMSSELYYNKMHGKLVEYIRSGDVESCAAEFDRALAAMEDISFKTAKSYFRHVLMSVLDDFSVSFERNDASFVQLMDYLGEIDGCQNVQSLKTIFLDFLIDLVRRLASNRKNSNQDAALQAKEYIDRNYQNPDLSLRMLAELAGLSPAYLGKVFTAVTAYTFNDYLNSVRTARAAELLLSTNLPISKISEKVGILNTNYFYSLFKKRYGVTPSAYRREPPVSSLNPGKESFLSEKED